MNETPEGVGRPRRKIGLIPADTTKSTPQPELTTPELPVFTQEEADGIYQRAVNEPSSPLFEDYPKDLQSYWGIRS